MANKYPRGMSVGGGGQPFISSNFKDPAAKSLYPRGSGVSKSAAVGALKKASNKNLSGMVANAKKYARPAMPVKSKPVAGASNYNPQS